MRAGELRHTLRLEMRQGSDVPGSRGQSTKEWVAVLTAVPAKVVTLAGLELIRARQLVAQATHAVTIRYLSDLADLKTKARFVLADPEGQNADRVLNVSHVDDIEQRRREMLILCAEEKP